MPIFVQLTVFVITPGEDESATEEPAPEQITEQETAPDDVEQGINF